MKPFNKVEYVKTELIGLENQIVSSAQRGATSLSVYLENFCAKILEIYYGYKFQNLNYESKNIEGVDLYNSKHKHAIQINKNLWSERYEKQN